MFHATGVFSARVTAAAGAARLPWYIQPCSRSGLKPRSRRVSLNAEPRLGKPGCMPQLKTGMLSSAMRTARDPLSASEITNGSNLSRSMRLKSLYSMVSAPPVLSPVMMCAILTMSGTRPQDPGQSRRQRAQAVIPQHRLAALQAYPLRQAFFLEQRMDGEIGRVHV